MTAAEAAELRQFLAARAIVPQSGGFGDMWVTRTPEGAEIIAADPSILVALQLIEESDGQMVSFAAGTLTIQAINRTVRYRVLGYADPTREVIACQMDEVP